MTATNEKNCKIKNRLLSKMFYLNSLPLPMKPLKIIQNEKIYISILNSTINQYNSLSYIIWYVSQELYKTL